MKHKSMNLPVRIHQKLKIYSDENYVPMTSAIEKLLDESKSIKKKK